MNLVYLIFSLGLMVSCGGSGGSNTGPGGPGATPTPTAVPVPPGDGDTVVIGEPGLCMAGDVARVDFDSSGKSRFSLVSSSTTCTPAKDNRKEEYTLILYNTSSSPISFRIDSPLSETPPATQTLRIATGNTQEPSFVKPPISSITYSTGKNTMDEKAETLFRLGPQAFSSSNYSNFSGPGTRVLVNLTIGDEVEFKVRSDPGDSDVFTTTSGVLRAQQPHINIFVDRDLPFGGINADSLNSTQLSNIAEIYEQNIYPLESALLGAPSDVDGDGRINVLVTPILNRDLQVAAYTDSRNTLPFDPLVNPGSNESEMIFVYAPDSLGNFTLGGNGIDVTTYVDKVLNAWIAFHYSKIISYNQHVLVSGGSAEDDWIADGIGALMSDLAGFNIWRPSVYVTLAQPQLDDLTKAEDLDFASFEGAEYLFMLYYVQSQIDTSVVDADADGFDDDLDVLSTLMTSGLVGRENLENAVDFSFDADVETEFQAIFKDWTIAIATSGTNRTDLQQLGQTAVKYFFNLNPLVLGTGINDASGSLRAGADGGVLDAMAGQNAVGLDLNDYHTEENTLIENADEHVYAPGNEFFGYVDPVSAMYVRLSGLFRASQVISILASSPTLKGFIVRRSDIAYPHTYSESIFGSIDQHPEDMDTAGPNPYWTGEGFAKKIDMQSLYDSTTAGNISQDFLTIVGKIDTSSQILACPEDLEACASTDVPDTDKYLITIPDDAGRTDDGDWVITLRRQFDEGSDRSALNPMLAIVSSKDVPYPYIPHPIRDSVNGTGTTDTRQQYRWMTTQLICGDDQAGGDTGLTTSDASIASCDPGAEEDSAKIIIEDGGLVENDGNLVVNDAASPWDGDILGGECTLADPSMAQFYSGVQTYLQTGGYGTGYYGVTSLETSPSSFGGYSWSQSFMEYQYTGGAYPDVLLARDFLVPVPNYPSIDPEDMYDPRSINSLTLNCHVQTGGTDPDQTPDSPDDFLTPSEIKRGSTLAEQILMEMSRSRYTSAPVASEASTFVDPKYDDDDIFAINGDSRDADTECNQSDLGNNMHGFTVRKGEGAILWADRNLLEPHVANNFNNSALDQSIYTVVNPSNTGNILLSPGKSYTLIVGGIGQTKGNYEIRIRKMNRSRISERNLLLVDANNIVCDREL
ncbi:MAG: hypothetical protein KDD48_02345 [Bdellovibrionales bacterium]|nr:hypothetical protein [Bdellovibrionales bacterium]